MKSKSPSPVQLQIESRRRLSENELLIEEAAVDMFNAAAGPGSPVIFIDDYGDHHSAECRSAAWMLPSGKGGVLLKDRAGAIWIGRIRIPMPPKGGAA